MDYKPGDYWVLCDQCGRRMHASESVKRWDNLIVHKDPNEGCFETRHPQEFVRAVPDQKPLPFVRPDNDGLAATLAIDCASITFRYFDRQDFEVLTEVYKARVQGPVEIPTTLEVVCTLEVY